MIEMLIVAAIWTVVVKRGVEDILHTARGNAPARYAAAKARRSSGAAGRYWGALWDDTFEDMLKRHNAKRERRESQPPRPSAKARWNRGLMVLRYARWDAHNRFKSGWARLAQKRREKATRPRPGQQTVPGTVVPNRPQDEDQDRPQDEDRPEPSVVQDEDDSPTPVPQDEHPQFDEDGIRLCPSCGQRNTGFGRICPSCVDEQEDEADRLQHPPDSGPDNQTSFPLASTTTQEGTTMTATMHEVVGLDSAIRFCEDSARAYRAQVQAIEHTQAAIVAGGVTGPAAAAFAAAMEQSNSAALSMETAATEFKSHKQVQEAYNAANGAGTREFVLNGQ